MVKRDKEQGIELSLETAIEIWNRHVSPIMNCFECDHVLIQFSHSSFLDSSIYTIFKASPERLDSTVDYAANANAQTLKAVCMGCQRLYMDNGAGYRLAVRNAIRAASTPLSTLPFNSMSVFPLVHRLEFHIPHSNRYVDGKGIVTPPDDVAREIDSIWANMYQPNRDSRIKKVKQQAPVASKQELYRLWWVSGMAIPPLN